MAGRFAAALLTTGLLLTGVAGFAVPAEASAQRSPEGLSSTATASPARLTPATRRLLAGVAAPRRAAATRGPAGLRRATSMPTRPPATASTSPSVTVDLGTGAAPQRSPDAVTPARRTPRGLVSEAFGGFQPGKSAVVEALGVRTVGRLRLPATGRIDPPAAAAALDESVLRTPTDFAWMTEAQVASARDARRLSTRPPAVAERARVFTAAGVGSARTLDEVPAGSGWVEVGAGVAGYRPGTTVYLTVAAEPVVIATATVRRDGTAAFSGAFPLDAVGAGGVPVQVLGTRLLPAVRVAADGRVHLPRETLAELRRFDGGTDATLTVAGTSRAGARHAAVRVVPLDETAPWWTLWIAAGVLVVALVLRRRGHLATRRRLGVAAGALAVSAAPALLLGWLALAYPVMGYGAAVAAAAGMTLWSLIGWRADGAPDAAEPVPLEPALAFSGPSGFASQVALSGVPYRRPGFAGSASPRSAGWERP